MAIAFAGTRTDVNSLRLAHPVIRTSSALEVTAAGGLMLSAFALWLLVIPLELLGFVA